MSLESLTLTELRQELQRLNIDVTTGSLRGEQRKAELLRRLQQAKPNNVMPLKRELLPTSNGESKRIPMNDLRAKCEALGLSTLTPGVTGESRYQELIRRLSVCEGVGVGSSENADSFDEAVIPKWGLNAEEAAGDIAPSINWGNQRRFIDDSDDDDDDEDDDDEEVEEEGRIDDRKEEEEDRYYRDKHDVNVIMEKSGKASEGLYSNKSSNVNKEKDMVSSRKQERHHVPVLPVEEDREEDQDTAASQLLVPSLKLPKSSTLDEIYESDKEEEEEEGDNDDGFASSLFPEISASNQIKVSNNKPSLKLDNKMGVGSTPRLNNGDVDNNTVSTYMEGSSLDTANGSKGNNILGASYFASILTPRLSPTELQKRLRNMKREMRTLVEKRSEAISLRSNGQGADLDVLTAEAQYKKVQNELSRIREEENEGRSGVSMPMKSKLIEAGKKMSFADLQFKLSTLEVSLLKQLTEARKQIVKEENKNPSHGTEAELAINAQIVVLTRALAAAKESEEKDRLERYEREKSAELVKLKRPLSNSQKENNIQHGAAANQTNTVNKNPISLFGASTARNSKETIDKVENPEVQTSKSWHPPQGPPLILDNPLPAAAATSPPKNQTKLHPSSPSSSSQSLASNPSGSNKKSSDAMQPTPGELLLQKAMKLLNQENSSHGRKKKIEPEKLAQIEKVFLDAIKYARVSKGQCSGGLLPRVLMHWGNFLWHEKECLEEASRTYLEAFESAQNDLDKDYQVGNSHRVFASVCAEYAGFLSKARRELDKAETVYLQGISADATHPRLLGNYARLLTNRGEYARADALYCQALDNSPLHGPTMINRAQLLKIVGKIDEAEELLRKAAYECSDISHRAQGANNLANFLWKVKGDLLGAKTAYIDGIKAKGPAGDKLLQRNYAVFLSRNKEMRSNTKSLSELPGRGESGGLGVLEEAEDPYEEMSTLDASVIKRIVASNKTVHSSNDEFFEED